MPRIRAARPTGGNEVIDQVGVAKHTPEWLEEIARRLYEADLIGGDGIAYALEWAAHDIRVLEQKRIAAAEANTQTIAVLKTRIALLEAAEREGAWS
jgi:hypothetical protein